MLRLLKALFTKKRQVYDPSKHHVKPERLSYDEIRRLNAERKAYAEHNKRNWR